MRARLGIDKSKSWADWAEEEEEAAEPTKTLADAKSEVAGEVEGLVRGLQFPVWPEFAITDFRMPMPSSPSAALEPAAALTAAAKTAAKTVAKTAALTEQFKPPLLLSTRLRGGAAEWGVGVTDMDTFIGDAISEL